LLKIYWKFTENLKQIEKESDSDSFPNFELVLFETLADIDDDADEGQVEEVVEETEDGG